MRIRFLVRSLLAALVALSTMALNVGAVEFPLIDPGFDVFQPDTTTLIADAQFTDIFEPAGGGGGPREDIALRATATAELNGAFGDIPAGWGTLPINNGLTFRFRNDDYVVWKNQFGQTAGGAAAGLLVAPIPEPNCLVLLGVGIFALAASQRRVWN